MELGRRIERIVAEGIRRREQSRSIDSHEARDTGMEGEPPTVRASPDNFDLDRRLDALVQIAVAQSQSMHEMAVSIQEHGRQIDRIIDAFMGLAKRSDENGQRE
jgi:hypothetical protein